MMRRAQPVARCTRCLLPDSYPGVTFDAEGVCNHCLSYREPELLGEEALLARLKGPAAAGSADAQYDCVVGISGGKDSCYVAYLAAKRFGLRPLAVSYDFPFMVDLARENIHNVCESLGIDLLVVSSRNGLETDLLRNHLLSLAATGTTWGQCMFCHYGIAAVLHSAARSRGIPFILDGVTPSETWWNPGNRLGYLGPRLKELPLGEKARFAFYQSRAYACLVDQRRQFPIPGNSPLNVYKRAVLPPDGPQVIPVFRYVKWDGAVIEKTLQAETGWQKPPNALTWRYDCILEPLLDLTFKREFGISSAGLYLCGLIRAGLMPRDEALALLEQNEGPARLAASLQTVVDALNIPADVQAAFTEAV